MRAVVLDARGRPSTDAMQQSNRETIERIGHVPVATLPYVDGPNPDALADAAGGLSVGDWLGGSGRAPARFGRHLLRIAEGMSARITT